tara:strand:+ start:303 stop:524 length:222 start_codon:yes stop_codon:yes gene_type:complete
MSVEDIVNNLKNGNNVEAGKAYDSVMAEKLRAAIDAKKIEIASSLNQRTAAEPVEPAPVTEPEGDVAQDEINN